MWKLSVRKGGNAVLTYSFETIQEAHTWALALVDARKHTDDQYTLSIAEGEEEPEAKMTKLIRLDTGKLYALADAGWKPLKIADELGCSEQTVRNYLNKRKERKACGQ